MSEPHPVPSGASHEVGREEIFFSTTDAKGVIQQANSVFVRLSRFRRERLIGAPHNIIRHPSMPGGAFLIMWETLAAGQPFCAYVDNLAADGSRYTVFATITPLGEDDYLSVRVRPRRSDLLEAAHGLYSLVRPDELERRAQGGSAHEAAELGLGRLTELLRGAGFASYDEFTWTALPAEVIARADVGYPERPDTTGDLGALLAAGGRVHHELTTWVKKLEALQELADALVSGGAELADAMAASEQAATDFSEAESVTGGFSPVMGSITLWVSMIGEINSLLFALAGRLTDLRVGVAKTRFGLALALLQSETAGRFACELIDGDEETDEAFPAIQDLVMALRQGISDAGAAARANAELAATVADEIQALGELIEVPTTLLEGFDAMVSVRNDPATAAMLPRVREVVTRSQSDAAKLLALAGRCRSFVELDPQAVSADLDEIDRLAGAAGSAGSRFA